MKNKKINKEKILHKMENKKFNIVSVDYENNIILCDDGNEYPIMEGCENFTIDELQEQMNVARDIVCEIIKKTEE